MPSVVHMNHPCDKAVEHAVGLLSSCLINQQAKEEQEDLPTIQFFLTWDFWVVAWGREHLEHRIGRMVWLDRNGAQKSCATWNQSHNLGDSIILAFSSEKLG